MIEGKFAGSGGLNIHVDVFVPGQPGDKRKMVEATEDSKVSLTCPLTEGWALVKGEKKDYDETKGGLRFEKANLEDLTNVKPLPMVALHGVWIEKDGSVGGKCHTVRIL